MTGRAGTPTAKRCRTAEAAAVTGLTARTLQEKAAVGEVPGARKVFGRWTYDVGELEKLGAAPTGQRVRQRRPIGKVSMLARDVSDRYEALFASARAKR